MVDSVRDRMRFGVFLPPIYRPRGNAAWGFERALQLAEKLDELGFDELYFGEHHSSGWEIVGSSEIMIAAAAQRTRRIKLGSGVVSLPYHHPFNVAERFLLLDHLTRGRTIMGVGPGALPSDARMLAIDYSSTRERMAESLEAILALFRDEGKISRKSDWFEMVDAQLQMKPYTRPNPELIVTAVASPNGPRLAGRLGLPIMSLTASAPGSRESLAEHWRVLVEQADLAGQAPPPRDAWRLVTPLHVARTREQAEREVEWGIEESGRYHFRDAGLLRKLLEHAGTGPDASMTEIYRRSGVGVIGTPDDAIAHIDSLQEYSGGFGTYLIMAQDWADHHDTLRSLETFAEFVIPHYQDGTGRREANWAEFNADSDDAMRELNNAAEQARRRYEQSKEADGTPPRTR